MTKHSIPDNVMIVYTQGNALLRDRLAAEATAAGWIVDISRDSLDIEGLTRMVQVCKSGHIAINSFDDLQFLLPDVLVFITACAAKGAILYIRREGIVVTNRDGTFMAQLMALMANEKRHPSSPKPFMAYPKP